jgi:hypothetical protein
VNQASRDAAWLAEQIRQAWPVVAPAHGFTVATNPLCVPPEEQAVLQAVCGHLVTCGAITIHRPDEQEAPAC